MPDNAFVKIGTALFKHQVKKLVGEETLGVISEELADIGGDKLDAWLGDKSTIEELEKAAKTAEACFHDSVGDYELEQWMVSLPIGDLPKVMEAIEKLPTSPNEKQLEEAIRESVAGWRKLSLEQTDKAVNSFLTCLRSALLPIEKQTLMVIGRSVLRTEDKVDLLVRWFEQYIITGKPAEIKQLNPGPVDYWNLKHPYAMPPNFTGRVEERKMLVDWLKNDDENRLFILRALGGFGKSALSWHWLTHDVDSKEWKKVLWWSFYEGDASFEHFIEETLKYLKLEVPQGQRPQVDALLKAMQSQKILLIMDGFERILRLYANMNAAYQSDEEQKFENNQLDCVNLSAEFFLKSICSLPSITSKILITTRHSPRAVKPRGEFLQGCHEEELIALQPADAVEFFLKRGIQGNRVEIEFACAPYGYHPLSLRILAGLIANDRERPNDIVAANKLDITDDIIQNKNHVLKVAYDTLSFGQQKLLRNMACFRSSMSYQALKFIFRKPSWKRKNKSRLNEKLDDILQTLESRGLLSWNRQSNKYDLHPIVRHYAYRRLDTSERIVAHSRLRDFFALAEMPANLETIDDLAPGIELYFHLIGMMDFDAAARLLQDKLVPNPLFFQFSAYQLTIELERLLFVNGEDKPPLVKTIRMQSWALNALANSYPLLGQPAKAVDLFLRSAELDKSNNDIENRSIGLGNAAQQQLVIGALKEAEHNQKLRIDLCRTFRNKIRGSEIQEAIAHRELGKTLFYLGNWQNAEQELELALETLKKEKIYQSLSVVWSYRVVCFLLMIRGEPLSMIQNRKRSFDAASHAYKLTEETTRTQVNVPRDYLRAYWLLGASCRVNNHLVEAENYLSKSVDICRQINSIDAEADILLDLSRLRYDQKKYEEAKSLADEALLITERCGYVLQGADVNLFLAQYTLEQEQDKAKAKEYAEEARKLATCDGPPYYYKVAYEEAERMLEKLKNEK